MKSLPKKSGGVVGLSGTSGRSGLKDVVDTVLVAASITGLSGVSKAKGLECQCHALGIDRCIILVGIEGSLGHTSCERSCQSKLVSKMGLFRLTGSECIISNYLDCMTHFLNAFLIPS